MPDPKPPGKGTGETAEAGDEKFQNERVSSIEAFLAAEFGYVAPVQTYGADAVMPPEEPSEEVPAEDVTPPEG